jgi:hypothetical protein
LVGSKNNMLFDVSHVHQGLRYAVLKAELRYVDVMAKGEILLDKVRKDHQILDTDQRNQTVSCSCGQNHDLVEFNFLNNEAT